MLRFTRSCRPQAREHVRFLRRPQAVLQVPQCQSAKRHAHSGTALANLLRCRPQAREHVRLLRRPRALLQVRRCQSAKWHAHSGMALAILPRSHQSVLSALAMLSCIVLRRCAMRPCWECRILETPESCPYGAKCLKTAHSSAISLVAGFGVEPRRRRRRRSAGNTGSTGIGRSKRVA